MKYFLFAIFSLFVFYSATAQNTAEDFADLGHAALNKGDYKTAVKQFELAIKHADVIDYYYDAKAYAHVKLEQFQEAYDTYTKGIDRFPLSGLLYNNRAILMLSSLMLDDAIEDFSVAISLADHDSTKFDALENRGMAKAEKRDFQGAYEDVIQVYRFDDTRIGTLTNLGMICAELGRDKEAFSFLNRALELKPNDVTAILNIGFFLQQNEEYKEAAPYFDKVIELDPTDALGYNNRGYNRLKMGDIKGAIKDIEKSIKLYPANSYAYRNRALVYIEQKNFTKACPDLQKAIDLGFIINYGEEVEELQRRHCKSN